jgi:hypothetical protein
MSSRTPGGYVYRSLKITDPDELNQKICMLKQPLTLLISTLIIEAKTYFRNVCNVFRMHTVQSVNSRINIKFWQHEAEINVSSTGLHTSFIAGNSLCNSILFNYLESLARLWDPICSSHRAQVQTLIKFSDRIIS